MCLSAFFRPCAAHRVHSQNAQLGCIESSHQRACHVFFIERETWFALNERRFYSPRERHFLGKIENGRHPALVSILNDKTTTTTTASISYWNLSMSLNHSDQRNRCAGCFLPSLSVAARLLFSICSAAVETSQARSWRILMFICTVIR